MKTAIAFSRVVWEHNKNSMAGQWSAKRLLERKIVARLAGTCRRSQMPVNKFLTARIGGPWSSKLQAFAMTRKLNLTIGLIFDWILSIADQSKGKRFGNGTELSDEDIEAASQRGRIAAATEPRASAVHYEVQADRVVIELNNGTKFEFSPRRTQGLEMADAQQLASVVIIGQGYGLQWDCLDVHLSVPGLVARTQAYSASGRGGEI